MAELIGGAFWSAQTFDGHMVDVYRTVKRNEMAVASFTLRYFGGNECRGLHESLENLAIESVNAWNNVTAQIATICTLCGFDWHEDATVLPKLPGHGPINFAVHTFEDKMYPDERHIEFGLISNQVYAVHKRGDNSAKGYIMITSGDGEKDSLYRIDKWRDTEYSICSGIPRTEEPTAIIRIQGADYQWLNASKDLLTCVTGMNFATETVNKIVGVLNSWK